MIHGNIVATCDSHILKYYGGSNPVKIPLLPIFPNLLVPYGQKSLKVIIEDIDYEVFVMAHNTEESVIDYIKNTEYIPVEDIVHYEPYIISYDTPIDYYVRNIIIFHTQNFIKAIEKIHKTLYTRLQHYIHDMQCLDKSLKYVFL